MRVLVLARPEETPKREQEGDVGRDNEDPDGSAQGPLDEETERARGTEITVNTGLSYCPGGGITSAISREANPNRL